MAKNPAERYATAQELADDLRRFLEDKPIRARRPTLWQRLRKWTRRHKAVVVATAVSILAGLLTTVGTLAADYLKVKQAHQDLTSAYSQERQAKNFAQYQNYR